MAEHSFPNVESAVTFLLGRHTSVDQDVLGGVAAEIVTVFKSDAELPGSATWQVGKYVIRDEDVDLFDAVVSAAPAAIAALTAAPPEADKSLVAAVVAASVAALKLLRTAVRSYAELSREERVLIATLKMSGGSMFERALIDGLIETSPGAFANEAVVLACLKGLEKKALRKGGVKPLVVVDGEGVWRSAV